MDWITSLPILKDVFGPDFFRQLIFIVILIRSLKADVKKLEKAVDKVGLEVHNLTGIVGNQDRKIAELADSQQAFKLELFEIKYQLNPREG